MTQIDLSSPDLFAQCTLPGLLTERARITGDRRLLRAGDETRTAAQMQECVSAVGALLLNAGISKGDRVALMSKNRTELLDLILGCAWIGAVAVPINVALKGEQLHHILQNSQARLLVVEAELLAVVELLGSTADVQQIWLIDRLERRSVLPVPVDDMPLPCGRSEAADVAPSDAAAILYTSGTTGIAKGVVCPHAQFYWWGHNVSRQVDLSETDVLYTCLPLFHTNALNAFSQALVCGAEYVMGPRFSSSRFWVEAKRHGATFTYLLGAMIGMLAGRPATRADRAHDIQAALAPATPASLLESFERRFGVALIDGYGSTETNAVISASRAERRAGYVGRVQNGFEARVIDPLGAEVPPGVAGELLLRSQQPHAFASGYFRMEEATVLAWRDLWFHTGDRVVIDEDGWMRFVDRIKDVIRRRGENISSVEVEAAIRSHPDVSDAAVYGVESPLGEEDVMAAVVLHPGVAVSAEDLSRVCEERIARFAVPRYIAFFDAFPMTENGKVKKAELRSMGSDRADWDRERPAVPGDRSA